MLATKVIKCKVHNPTKTKFELLDTEYNNVQHFIQTGEDLGCYSNYKFDLIWKNKKGFKRGKEYPLPLRHPNPSDNGININYETNFIRVRVKGRRGGVWLPVKPHIPLSPDYKIHDSRLIKTKHGFQINLTVSKEVEVKSISSLIAIDLGEKVTATAVLSGDLRPMFYGREIRGIRRHYAWLRKRLGNKKLLGMIRKVGNTEQRKTDAILHKISRDVVNVASKTHSAIVLGNVHGIRQRSKNKGRRFNRIVNSWAFDKLSKMIEYKALWEGIPVVYVNEDYTSVTCSKCHNEGRRSRQGLFVCPACGYRINADFNGAKNILERVQEYTSCIGAIGSSPMSTPASVQVNSLS